MGVQLLNSMSNHKAVGSCGEGSDRSQSAIVEQGYLGNKFKIRLHFVVARRCRMDDIYYNMAATVATVTNV